jgi:hypothetical protein
MWIVFRQRIQLEKKTVLFAIVQWWSTAWPQKEECIHVPSFGDLSLPT